MRVENPKCRDLTGELLDRAVEFHGHGGPFMVVGLRMGLAALRVLDAEGWFDINSLIRLRWRPPDSCVIDGIQIATGCTMGKHNIEVIEGDGIEATFTRETENLKITLRQEIHRKIIGLLSEKREEPVKKMMEELSKTPDNEIFEFS